MEQEQEVIDLTTDEEIDAALEAVSHLPPRSTHFQASTTVRSI